MPLKSKNILQLIESWGPGGAEKVVLELAKGMNRERFQPIVGLFRTGWLHQQLARHGIETILFNNNYACDPIFLWKIWRVVKEKKIDLIHAHEFTMNVYGALAAHVAGVPSLATIHGNKYYPEKKRRRAAYKLIASLPNTHVITVSYFLKNYFCQTIGADTSRIRMIYNGVDYDRFRSNGKKFNQLFEKEKKISGPFIGTIGNLYPGKGHIYLIRAASMIVERFPNAKIFIVGKKTGYQVTLEKEAERLNLRRNIFFLGFREDVPSILKNLDIFVLPSLQETFSLAVVEAMAANLPVIATKCGGPEEIVIDGFNGFLVAPGDHQALAEKILLILEDKDLGEKMAMLGREKVESDYTVERMISNYQSLYFQTLS